MAVSSWPSLLMKKMDLTKGKERFYNPGLSLQRWYKFLIAESGWKWPRDTSDQSTLHGCFTCSGGIKTILLATTLICRRENPGLNSARYRTPNMPWASLELHPQQTWSVHVLMSHTQKELWGLIWHQLWPDSHYRDLIHALLGCRNRCFTHTIQTSFPSLWQSNVSDRSPDSQGQSMSAERENTR